MRDVEDWDELAAGLRAGDARAARRFWEIWGPMLHDVAERRLAVALRRRVGPEDVVQSVCRTFLRRVQGGDLVLEDAERLWHLLCAIAVTKARAQARFHGRQKRALARETPLDAGPEEAPIVVVDPMPSPEAMVVADELEAEIAALDDEAREIVLLKIADLTHDEIAQRLGCSERTVRRVVQKVRERLAHRLAP
ncbi:MAG: sigma-70 family RNA polymerase sigma factor [Deltaproteobacteria bacterium]|nr:sigma-70 family RNA polymerase sigma factor [Deltaproteobacteria bacterium]